MRHLLFVYLALSACRGQVSEEPPVVPIRNMYQQPRYDSQEASEFFQDGRTMRPPVEGTLAVEMEPNSSVATGRTDDNSSWVLEVPSEIVARFHPSRGRRTFASGRMESASWSGLDDAAKQEARRAMLERGEERYNIYCAPCHSEAGDGWGLVTHRAMDLAARGVSASAASLKPPSFHDDTYRHMPDGQVYATITNGVGNMPAYSQSIPVADRWAIVAHVRVLQLVNPAPAPADADAEDAQ